MASVRIQVTTGLWQAPTCALAQYVKSGLATGRKIQCCFNTDLYLERCASVRHDLLRRERYWSSRAIGRFRAFIITTLFTSSSTKQIGSLLSAPLVCTRDDQTTVSLHAVQYQAETYGAPICGSTTHWWTRGRVEKIKRGRNIGVERKRPSVGSFFGILRYRYRRRRPRLANFILWPDSYHHSAQSTLPFRPLNTKSSTRWTSRAAIECASELPLG